MGGFIPNWKLGFFSAVVSNSKKKKNRKRISIASKRWTTPQLTLYNNTYNIQYKNNKNNDYNIIIVTNATSQIHHNKRTYLQKL